MSLRTVLEAELENANIRRVAAIQRKKSLNARAASEQADADLARVEADEIVALLVYIDTGGTV